MAFHPISSTARLKPVWCAALFVGVVLLLLLSSPRKTPIGNGFFAVRGGDGRWFLADPAGNPFFATGVSCVWFHGYPIIGTSTMPYTQAVTRKFGTHEAWARATMDKLTAWGFNTLGAWSDEDLARLAPAKHPFSYAPILDLGGSFAGRSIGGTDRAWVRGIFPDVFDPSFPAWCQDEARRRCLPLKDDPALLGWFVDNELRWTPDGNSPNELLVTFLNLDPRASGRRVALDLLHRRYPTIASFNQAWGTYFHSWVEADAAPRFFTPAGVVRPSVFIQNQPSARDATTPRARAYLADCDAFLALLAQHYFQVTHDAIEAVDPHHLQLGCRFAVIPPPPVLRTAAQYEDVISFNCYQADPTATLNVYAGYQRPTLISEFTFRGRDSGLPNTKGAGPVVPTQLDRAKGFEFYARAAAANPSLVGYIWFDFADEPKEGRFDGENSNYGLVDINDRPYGPLVSAMSWLNREACGVETARDR